MSLHFTANTPLRVVSNTYAANGSPVAVLPFSATELLAASATNVNYFDIRPTAEALSGSNELSIADDAMTDDADCDVTITRPFGGEDMATIGNLRALQIRLTADEATTAEMDAGVIGARAIGVYWRLNDGADSTTFARGYLAVAAAGEFSETCLLLPETYGADMKLSFFFDFSSLKVRLQLLTVAE